MKKSLSGKTVAPYVAPPLTPPCAIQPCDQPTAHQCRQVGTGRLRYLCEEHKAWKERDESMIPLSDGEPKEAKPCKIGRPEKPKNWKRIS